jgi:sterol desaturase/sphingolipid hydroxylase (fatty acid hydroxylase superfamily)
VTWRCIGAIGCSTAGNFFGASIPFITAPSISIGWLRTANIPWTPSTRWDLINLPAFVLGFPLETIAGLLAFRGMWAIYIHSNVRLPIGLLRYLIGAPELHHWHHSREREAGNYANISPLMDVLFGTYRCPPHEPKAFGLQQPLPASYLGQLLHPFRLKRKT